MKLFNEVFLGGLDQSTDVPLPTMSDREYLESMKPDDIVDLILKDGERVTQIEKRMDLASEVLEGAYGLTVEEVLNKREERKTNGEQK